MKKTKRLAVKARKLIPKPAIDPVLIGASGYLHSLGPTFPRCL
jgi:hypothetical protein